MGKDMGALHPIFRDRLQRLFDATGCYANSTWRSSEEQQYFRNCYVNCNCNNCNPANEAGSSNHEAVPWGEPMGLAADIGGDLAAAYDVCSDYGLHFPIHSSEPWHIQPVEVPYAYWTGLPDGWADPDSGGGRYTIRKGSKGSVVVDLQQRLVVHGAGIDVDGDFGTVTESAVVRFQETHGLTVDGIVGPSTWAALDAEPAVPAPTPPAPADPVPIANRKPAGELRMSSQGAALIATYEGLVLRLYNDPVGHCTVGIGHLVHQGNCDGRESESRWAGRELSNEEAYKLFIEEDIGRYEDGVRRHITVALFQSEFDALVSFSFNLGADILDEADCTLARLLNQGDYEGASNEFGKWANAGGQRLEGLVRRRAEERELFRAEWNGSVTPTPDAGAPGWPGRNLRPGMSGQDVRQFQAELATRRWAITADGDFGNQTEGVVMAFQAEKGLIADGIVGADTWWAIFHSEVTGGPPAERPSHPEWPGRYLRQGDQGDDVRAFQQRMVERGWTWVDVDGDFGPTTYKAVVQFQQEKGITVDGVVGPSTWNSFWTAPTS